MVLCPTCAGEDHSDYTSNFNRKASCKVITHIGSINAHNPVIANEGERELITYETSGAKIKDLDHCVISG